MEIISTIKEQITVSAPDFKSREWKEQTVKIVRHDGTIMFYWEIPKFMLDEAKSINPEKYKDYKKFFRFPQLEIIKDMAQQMCHDLEEHHTFKDEIGEKVIFIKFHGQHGNKREGTYGAGMGKEITMRFNYFTAFRYVGQRKRHLSTELEQVEEFSNFYQRSDLALTQESQAYRDKEIKPLHHTKRDKDNLKHSYLIVEWTPEREAFLERLQQLFILQTDQLNEYLKDLTTEKLDNLIQNSSPIKLLTDGS